jgi:thiol-disulfide isomerase/thioredoxin
MKRFSALMLLRALAALFPVASFPVLAADTPTATLSAAPERTALENDLQTLVEKIRGKLSAGAAASGETGGVSADAFTDELKAFDQLLVAYKDEKPERRAQVLVYKGVLYLQVFSDYDAAAAAFRQLKADFPETPQANQVDATLQAIEMQQAAQKVQGQLAVGAPFPDFEEKDLSGQPLSVAKFKGSVVLVDFWATWCGPCVADMPDLIELYKKYHPRGFEIIGVSLDREESALKSYLEKNQITWPQYFDGQFWDNKLSRRYGVTSIPFTILVDGEGRIVGKNLRGPELAAAVAKLLGQ